MTLTLSHIDCERAPTNLSTSEGDIDGVRALLGGFVGAAVATVSLVLDVASHCVLLASWIHDYYLHLTNSSP